MDGPLVILLAGSAVSALLEAFQAVAAALGRSCSANDWLYNSLSTVLGAVLALAALRIAGRRSP